MVITPWDELSVERILKMGVKFLKVASIDANNFQFCEYIAKKRYPTIISTGMCTYDEILKRKNFKNINTHIFYIVPLLIQVKIKTNI